ncbi:MAG TPA: class I SAM-dependent methyltransferase [Pyrinomonadaceae bacterium]|jgi:SAM-dependent methyltransferase|nr:class I SAM-dependent methyltransferase [Pyrinomonadaceae bacterium]
MTKSPSSACRACGSPELRPILDLGVTPLANGLLTAAELDKPEATYPLELVFCPACTLVQITVTVPPEQLFREYVYFSSFSETMLRHAGQLVAELTAGRGLDQNSFVIEVASNDGYLLQGYQRSGIPVLGIEPATNIARVARERGIPTIAEFFGVDLARQLAEKGQQADVVHAHNVLAHVPDLNGFAQGLQLLLKEEGIAVIEVPYVKDLIDRVEFDTIYHEHLCYFSLTALDHLFNRHGLIITDAVRVPIHGGTLRVFVRRRLDDNTHPVDERSGADSLRAEELEWAVNPRFYQRFADKVEAVRRNLLALLRDLKARNKRIGVYGASAKGSTLLNYCQIGREILDFAVDRSTVKQGRYMPGVHLPIYAPEKLLEEKLDYALLLAWNIADEILEQQAGYRSQGGRFIVPLPDLKIM